MSGAALPVRYRSVHDVIEDHYVRVYATPRARVAHAASSSLGAAAVCGVEPPVTGGVRDGEWFGTGCQAERDTAAALHLCGVCASKLRSAFRIGSVS